MARHTVRVLVLVTLALLLTGSVRLVQEAGAAGGSVSVTSSLLAPALGLAGPGIPAGSRELPALRRRNSRTYVTPAGTHVATISPRSVNYADEKGDWQPIENALVPSSEPGYSHESRGNRYKLALPSDLGAQPVRVSLGESWISFKLEGGRGSGVVSGKSARYANALSGVEVAYSAEADAVKEILKLASASAPSSFTWTLRTGPGLTASENGSGGINFKRSSGEVAFAFAAPFMYDASAGSERADRIGKATFDLSTISGGYKLTLSADRRWLADSARRFPVTIDPMVTFLDPGDCYIINSTSSDTTTCYYASLYAGALEGGAITRSLLYFDMQGQLPEDARVHSATLALHLWEDRTGTVPVSVHQLTNNWDVGVTWNSRDGTNRWTTPGGEFAPASSYTQNAVGGTAGWRYWYPSSLVRSWADGRARSLGFLLKATDESLRTPYIFRSSEYADSTYWPTLSVYYSTNLGERPYYSFHDEQLTDRSGLRVNLANGNLIVHHNDLGIAGTGLDLSLDRSYHSRAYEPRAFGNSWRLGTGTDITLSPLADGSYIFEGTNGLSAFEPLTGGGFTKPPGLNATLVRNADASYTVKADRSGEKLNFAAAGGPLRSHVDRNGNTISFTYAQTTGGALRLASIRDTQGRDTLFGYGDASSSKVTSVTDPAGRRSSYSYVGNLLQSYTAADGSLTGYSYDSGENLIAIADTRGGEVRFTYDANRRVTAVSRLLDYGAQSWATTRFSYDLVNRRTVVTDANGNNTSYNWDSLSRVTSVTDAAANVFRTSYTANSDVDTTTSATGAVTDNDYDVNNKLILTRLPTGATTSAAYADAQNPYLPTTVTDAQAKSESYTYDARGNILSSTNQLPSDNVSRWTYNANGTVATATDALRNVTSYSYFANGNLQRVTPPAPLGSTSYTYDSLSRVATETDGKGQTKTYGYDALDRVLSISYPGAAAPIAYRYDLNGNQVGVTDPAGGSTFWYDAANRKITEWGPNNSGTGMGTYYTYDPAGNLLSMRDARGTTSYAYNALHQTTGVTEPDNVNNVTRFTYDGNGNRTQTIYPNGVTQFEQYDASERLTRIYAQKVASGQLLTDFTYSYSQGTTDRELVQRMTDLGTRLGDPRVRSTSYSYSAVADLTGATTQIAGSTTNWWLYAYDGNGNRRAKTHNDVTTDYVYNAAGELATATTGNQTTTYSYDANGNRTRERRASGSEGSFTYNALDQTTSITPVGGSAISMTYAGAGQERRVAAGTTTFVNDGLGLGTRTAGGASTHFTRERSGQLIELDQSSGWDQYYLFDGGGSVIATTGADGALVNGYDYDPFGETIVEVEDEEIDNPFEYLGLYEDEDTDLLVAGDGEYYDVNSATWTKPDRCRWSLSPECSGGAANFPSNPSGRPSSRPRTGTASPASARISFSQQSGQSHGARHLKGTGLKPTEVESGIVADVRAAAALPPVGQSFTGRIQVRGITIEYKAHVVSAKRVNIGTYYVPK